MAGSWKSVTQLALEDNQLSASLEDGTKTPLKDSSQLVGTNSKMEVLIDVCLIHHGLHIILQIDPNHQIGKESKAGIKDMILESAITTIQDFEDSVTAVDAEDKVIVYRNWAGIMKGTLEASFNKGDRVVSRALNEDKQFTSPDGQIVTLKGRSLLLARNVGIHMFTDAVLTRDGNEIPEGMLDAMVSALAAIHDLKGAQ